MAMTDDKIVAERPAGSLRDVLRDPFSKKSLRWTWSRIASLGSELLPKGLYARALIIIIAPIVLLEGVVAFAFMERHWQSVTRRLSESTARDIAALIEVYDGLKPGSDQTRLLDMAREKLGISMQILPPGDLPTAQPKQSPDD